METLESAATEPVVETASKPVDPAKLRDYVEEFALVMESEGLPRMAGRILGYLAICEPPERTAAELARDLDASAGSISSMSRLLVSSEMVQRVSRPGERADRYRIAADSATSLMRGSAAKIARLRRLTDRGLDLLADRPPEVRARLAGFHDIYSFFEEQMPALVQQFERRYRENGR